MKISDPTDVISRRSFIRGIAALMGSQALPATKLLPILEAETIGWPAFLLQALPLVRLFSVNSDPGLIWTERDLIDEPMTTEGTSLGFEAARIFQPTFGTEKSEYSKRLKLVWQSNLSRSIKLLTQARQIEEASRLDVTLTPKEFFTVLEDTDNRKKLGDLFYKDGRHGEFLPDFVLADGWSEQDIQRIYQAEVEKIKELQRWYPGIGEAETFLDVASAIRRRVSEALLLPLEDGCFDVIENHNLEPNALQILLREVPELFPQGKIQVFRKIADDISQNGRQTVRLSEISKTIWRMSAASLLYSWGYSPLQVAWPMPQYATYLLGLGYPNL